MTKAERIVRALGQHIIEHDWNPDDRTITIADWEWVDQRYRELTAAYLPNGGSFRLYASYLPPGQDA